MDLIVRRIVQLEEKIYENLNFYTNFTVNHIVSERASRSTIFDIIKSFEARKSAKHHAGGGGRPKKNLSDWSIKKTVGKLAIII